MEGSLPWMCLVCAFVSIGAQTCNIETSLVESGFGCGGHTSGFHDGGGRGHDTEGSQFSKKLIKCLRCLKAYKKYDFHSVDGFSRSNDQWSSRSDDQFRNVGPSMLAHAMQSWLKSANHFGSNPETVVAQDMLAHIIY